MAEDVRPYRHVRSLQRGLALLQELNRCGSGRPADLARNAGIDRTTTYRLLATLEQAGLVRENPGNDEFTLTEHVRTLSDGFTERDKTIQAVATHLGTLFQKVLWPTDFATFERGAMVIRETTHRFSPYSVHRAMVGRPRSLLTTALGRAAIVGASPEHRTLMLDILRGTATDLPADPAWLDVQVSHILDEHERRGYSWAAGHADVRINAIGVAVRMPGGASAAINLVFFRTAMSIETAAERYLEHLKTCASQIEASLRGDDEPVST